MKARVQEKMNNDYEGIFLRVVDVVRSSAVFHSLLELNAAVVGRLGALNLNERTIHQRIPRTPNPLTHSHTPPNPKR